MFADAKRPGVLLTILFGMLLLVPISVLVVLAPILTCPDGHGQVRYLAPCISCNGHGRSTILQRWNYLQYLSQEEEFQRSVGN